ncbi:MAG: ABC transporter permease subunit, partial [Leptolyngbyaceae cyanobacterium SM1_1_3]|nr:ABC transporter permease subunit [Leptolyngbyaceae cyanobacterium SM1_1_3]
GRGVKSGGIGWKRLGAWGMSLWQRWWRVQVPLVLPVFLAGVRLSAIVAIAIATIGAKFSAGGLGNLLFEGIQTNRSDKIWAGAIAVALLALVVNAGLRSLEQAVSPYSRGSQVKQQRRSV